MAKTWKDMLKVKQQRIKERDWIAKDLGTPKYRQRVISNKRTKDAEAKMLEEQEMTRKLYGDGGYCAED